VSPPANWRNAVAAQIKEARELLAAQFAYLKSLPRSAEEKAFELAAAWGWFAGDKIPLMRQAFREARH
jgi:phytoene/squalene synthetase